MFDNNTIDSILSLINKEVVPAVGCTEPMAVALCTAKATEILGRRPEKITVMLSANMLKNANYFIDMAVELAKNGKLEEREKLFPLEGITADNVAEYKKSIAM